MSEIARSPLDATVELGTIPDHVAQGRQLRMRDEWKQVMFRVVVHVIRSDEKTLHRIADEADHSFISGCCFPCQDRMLAEYAEIVVEDGQCCDRQQPQKEVS